MSHILLGTPSFGVSCYLCLRIPSEDNSAGISADWGPLGPPICGNYPLLRDWTTGVTSSWELSKFDGVSTVSFARNI